MGGLATRPPAPSQDGRTYVFTLRRGVRYSDGTPVRPGDFRASMERYLRVSRDSFPPLFTGIVGAPRCISKQARCDLSRGIDTDAHARTITVHLTAPDPDFLHKLTMPFAYLVPSGTPARGADENSRQPAPARTAAQVGTGTAAACSSATRTSGRPPRGRPGSRIGSRSSSAGRDGSRRTPRRSTAAARMA